MAADLDLGPLERGQVELAVDGERQGVVAAAVQLAIVSPSGLAERRPTCLISCASFCRSSLDPLRMIRQAKEQARASKLSYQYCAFPLSLWYVRPWMVLYLRMDEVREAVESASSSPSAESPSSSSSSPAPTLGSCGACSI